MRITIAKRLAVLFVAYAASIAAARAETSQWLQYVPGGLEARAITTEAACPSARVNGGPAAMTVRADRSAAFPVLTCALRVPARATAVAIGDVALRLPPPVARRILVIGDTGCRLKGKVVQLCNNVADWPFQAAVAQATALKPDLVIHVGDYYYRETPCPAGIGGCAGSPYGDNWSSWSADFFAPGAALLHAAPWVLVRGNHETCRRGGLGWSRMLDPRPVDPATPCLPMAEPFTVPLGGITLVVMDVATAREDAVDAAAAATYRRQFEGLAQLGRGPVWLTMHRPIWAPFDATRTPVIGGNKTLAAATDGAMPQSVSLLLSGHIHAFQAESYDGDRPAQIVAGNGGDKLAETSPARFDGITVDGVTVKYGRGLPNSFGFSVLERRADDGWTLTDHDVQGRTLMTCRLAGRSVSCN